MKTKSLLAVLALLLVATFANAQNEESRGNRQRMDPTEIYTRMADRIAKQLKLDDDKAGSFKVLYLDYQTARQNALNPKGENQKEEKTDLKKITDEKAEELIAKQFATQEAQLKVDKEYYAKFKEILTPSQIAQFYIQNNRGFGMQRQGGQRNGNGNGPRGGGFQGGGFPGGGGGFPGGGDF